MVRGLGVAFSCAVLVLAYAAEIGRTPIPNGMPASSASAFDAGCNGSQPGVNYRNSSVEPWLAVDPRNPRHMVGAWQQDRWSNGGASGLVAAVSFDGGSSWTRTSAHFTRCSGGTVQNGGDFDRASDPWVSIGPDGTAYQISLSFDQNFTKQAILVSRSRNGGLNWEEPATLIRETAAGITNDKESLSADPNDARYAYAVWDRLSGLSNPQTYRGPSYFTRTSDGGGRWEPARAIYDPGANAQTIGNQILVLADGTLVNAFTLILNASVLLARDASTSLAVIRSTDRGDTWSDPVTIAKMNPVGVSSVKTGQPVRSSGLVPLFAIDRASGILYAVWQDGRFSGGKRSGIAISRSIDGGLTWSGPVQVNQAPDVQAFTPSVATGPNGTVAVTYYDFRKDTSDANVLLATLWRVVSADGGATWTETALSEPFDLTTAPIATGGGYFVGDYHGLVPYGGSFLAFFAATGGRTPGNLTDVFAVVRRANIDRSGNGRVEVNRHLLRLHERPSVPRR